jgi:hypothetical protein
MRFPHFTVRRLLFAVAVTALVLTTVVMVKPSGEFRELAEEQAGYEAGSLE